MYKYFYDNYTNILYIYKSLKLITFIECIRNGQQNIIIIIILYYK